MSRRRGNREKATLLLTPMIDVMTVLLAVFVVTAPMLTSGIDLDLPKAGNSILTGDDHSIQVSVDSKGNYFVSKQQMKQSEVVKKVVAMRQANPKLTVMINGDQASSYGAVMSVMGALKDAGVQKVGLRTRIDS